MPGWLSERRSDLAVASSKNTKWSDVAEKLETVVQDAILNHDAMNTVLGNPFRFAPPLFASRSFQVVETRPSPIPAKALGWAHGQHWRYWRSTKANARIKDGSVVVKFVDSHCGDYSSTWLPATPYKYSCMFVAAEFIGDGLRLQKPLTFSNSMDVFATHYDRCTSGVAEVGVTYHRVEWIAFDGVGQLALDDAVSIGQTPLVELGMVLSNDVPGVRLKQITHTAEAFASAHAAPVHAIEHQAISEVVHAEDVLHDGLDAIGPSVDAFAELAIEEAAA